MGGERPGVPSIDATHRQTESTAVAEQPARAYRGEQLTIRNHDERTGYGLTLRVTTVDGDVLERTGYYVGSGTTKRVFDRWDAGEVTVDVVHAGESVGSVTTQLDDTSAGTVVIECGNGAVTVTSGPA